MKSHIKVIFFADVVGKPGRFVLSQMCRPLMEKFGADYAIANIENAAGGFGITPEMARKIFSYGVNCQTSGNHIWDRMDILKYLDEEPRLIRPANYPPGCPGAGHLVDEVDGIKLGILNLMGRVYMSNIDCPFRVADRKLKEIREITDIVIIDFHAEATSEKLALAHHAAGRVSALAGTHTHIPTADERVIPPGTAYITDLGMTGGFDSILGREIKPVVKRFLTGMPAPFPVSSHNAVLQGAVIEIVPETGRAVGIRRVNLSLQEKG